MTATTHTITAATSTTTTATTASSTTSACPITTATLLMMLLGPLQKLLLYRSAQKCDRATWCVQVHQSVRELSYTQLGYEHERAGDTRFPPDRRNGHLGTRTSVSVR